MTLLAILVVLMVFLFPAFQGPYSVVHGPATAFRATWSARIAYVSIVQGALPMQLGRVRRLELSQYNDQRVLMLEDPGVVSFNSRWRWDNFCGSLLVWRTH